VDLHKWFAFSVLTLQAPIARFQFLRDKVPFPIDAHIYIVMRPHFSRPGTELNRQSYVPAIFSILVASGNRH